jgi:hypothetical protein
MSKVNFPPISELTVSVYLSGSPDAEAGDVIVPVPAGAKVVWAGYKRPVVTAIIVIKTREFFRHFIVHFLKYANGDFVI